MPIQSWDDIEAAFCTWLGGSTGLPVIWANQDAEQPTGDYCSLKIESIQPLGDDYVWSNFKASPARASGSEVELQVVGDREVSLMVQAYTASVYGTSSARQLLSKAQMKLWLPSQDALFGPISIFDVQSVQDVPVVLEAEHQGRAAFRVRFYVRDTFSEFTTWIETVTPPTGTFNEG